MIRPNSCQKRNSPSLTWGNLYPSEASGKLEGGSHAPCPSLPPR